MVQLVLLVAIFFTRYTTAHRQAVPTKEWFHIYHMTIVTIQDSHVGSSSSQPSHPWVT